MTAELPPPQGAPYPQPGPPPPAAPQPAAPVPPTQAYAYPAPLGPADPAAPAAPPATDGLMPLPGEPLMARPRTPVPGTNGLAIAALCCGIVGFVPLAAVVAVVLGIVALNQLRDRIQRGRGLAVAGLVIGALWLVGWALFIVAVVTDEPQRDASGQVTQQDEVFVDDLKAGDCFSGGRQQDVDLVTVLPCSAPHEGQVVTTFELPAGPFPGEDAVTAAAEDGCRDKAAPLLTTRARTDLDPSFFYPADAYTWRGDRTIACVVEAPSGTTTGSALR